ncbi:MAG: serine/threonine protein kinase, partial [Planctomycetes bacterium]|nr:serine/threonine protein kinase [Planctomycetota bacterium]
MSEDRKRVEELFLEARSLDAGERVAFLDRQCAGDASLREELEELLRYDQSDDPFLDTPIIPQSRERASAEEELPPTDCDGYRLLQLIGTGGFGEVYLAEQIEPVRRRVAIKLIKAGMDSREVLARFQVERQALALMDHSGIARILDAGTTTSGRPYFAMEHIRGVSITEYCDQQQLGVEARIELVIAACEAVHHAHQKGIIHRDLKPSNILVTLRDGRAAPVVIDFGIAKALDRPLTGQSVVTELRLFLGTPDYVSPEQAELTSLDVDTRTDIYAMGVLLYELLTGTTPFDLRSTTVDEVRRVIREVDPVRPSTRVNTLGSLAQEAARTRGTDSRSLSRAFAGDLDWVVLKCLEKDRTRRYDSASALAQDLRRHLEHEPVLASPPSVAYRLRKFVRRNRVSVFVVIVIAFAITLGLTFAAIGLVESARGQHLAERQARRAEAVSEFFVRRMIDAANPSVGGGIQTPVGQVLDQAAAEVGTAFPGEPDIEATIRFQLSRAYEELGNHDAALEHIERALEFAQVSGSIEVSDVLSWRAHRAGILLTRGDYRQSALELERLLPEVVASLGPDHEVTLRVETSWGVNLWRLARHEEAVAVNQRGVEKRIRLFGRDHLETAKAKSMLALSLRALDRLPEAIALYEEVIAV